ncbi:MAG: Na+/H+ antiporter, partial [uncultured Solirubrobacteraceae bacterium]
ELAAARGRRRARARVGPPGDPRRARRAVRPGVPDERPVPDLADRRRLRPGLRAGDPGRRARARPRAHHRAAAAAVRGGAVLRPARAETERPADRTARGRPGPVHDARHRCDRAHAHPGAVVGGGVRARRRARPDRPGRGDRDRRPRRGAAAGRLGARGREPDQRRHRADRVQVRGRRGHRGDVLAVGGRRRVRPERRGRARDRRGGRRRRRVAAGADRRRGDAVVLLARQRVLRLPAGRRPGGLGRGRRGDDRHLRRVEHAAHRRRDDAAAALRDVGRRRVPAELDAVRARRAPAPVGARRPAGARPRAARPVRARDRPGGDGDPLRVGVPGDVPAAAGVAATAREGPDAAMAVDLRRRVHRDARRGLARRGARHPRVRRGARPHRVPLLHDDPVDRLRRGALAAVAAAQARRAGGRHAAARGGQGADGGRRGGDPAHRRARRRGLGARGHRRAGARDVPLPPRPLPGAARQGGRRPLRGEHRRPVARLPADLARDDRRPARRPERTAAPRAHRRRRHAAGPARPRSRGVEAQL